MALRSKGPYKGTFHGWLEVRSRHSEGRLTAEVCLIPGTWYVFIVVFSVSGAPIGCGRESALPRDLNILIPRISRTSGFLRDCAVKNQINELGALSRKSFKTCPSFLLSSDLMTRSIDTRLFFGLL